MADTPEVAVARYAATISLWALGVAGGSLIVAASLLILEVRRWFDEGVRLSVSVMVDAQFIGGPKKDDNTYIAVTVTNRGSSPTTITHLVLCNYPSRLAHQLPAHLHRYFKRLRPQTFVVMHQGNMPLPHVLEPGRNWHGLALHTPDLNRMIDEGRLDVGIVGSHSDKTLFKHVRRWKPPEDSKPT